MAVDEPRATVHKHTQTHRRRSRQREQDTHPEEYKEEEGGRRYAGSNTHVVLCRLRRSIESVACAETKRKQETMHEFEFEVGAVGVGQWWCDQAHKTGRCSDRLIF